MTLMIPRAATAPLPPARNLRHLGASRGRTPPSLGTTRLRAACAAGALLGALAAGPAAAQLTAETVRTEFEATQEVLGVEIEVGSEDAADGTVTLSDVVLSFDEAGREEAADKRSNEDTVDEPAEKPEEQPGDEAAAEGGLEDLRVEARFDEIAFAERPDGTVAVTLSPEGRMTLRARDAGTGAESVVEMRLVAEGFEMTVAEAGAAAGGAEAGGDPGGLRAGRRTDYAADRLAVVILEATRGGAPVEVDGEIALTNVAGSTVASQGAGPAGDAARRIQSATLGGLAIDFDLPAQDDDGEDAGRVALAYAVSDVTLTAEATLPEDAAGSEADPTALLDAGLAIETALSYGPMTFEIVTEGGADPAQDATIEGTGTGGRLDVALDAGRLAYASGGEGLRVVVEGGGMPIERVEVEVEEIGGSLRVPVSAGDGAEPFSVGYALSGLTLNEEAWALIDPDGRLPRDAASLSLAVDGLARLRAGLFDEAAQAEIAAAGDSPADVEAASLDLSLEAVGTLIEVVGDFVFDPSDTTTFEGVPAPTGTLSIEAAGIDALLDTLAEMGLVPSDRMMPARLMLGLFARADGAGGYTSEIEVDGATGAVTANGQRLR